MDNIAFQDGWQQTKRIMVSGNGVWKLFQFTIYSSTNITLCHTTSLSTGSGKNTSFDITSPLQQDDFKNSDY